MTNLAVRALIDHTGRFDLGGTVKMTAATSESRPALDELPVESTSLDELPMESTSRSLGVVARIVAHR